MVLTWTMAQDKLDCRGLIMPITCEVRNELNGRRLLTEVPVFTTDRDGNDHGRGYSVPYMPRRFPKGSWTVYKVEPKADPYMAPYFIATDAWQAVEEWSILNPVRDDELFVVGGQYGVPTGRRVQDYGYGLHFSTSTTTLGCGKIVRRDDCIELVTAINECLERDESVKLLVE